MRFVWFLSNMGKQQLFFLVHQLKHFRVHYFFGHKVNRTIQLQLFDKNGLFSVYPNPCSVVLSSVTWVVPEVECSCSLHHRDSHSIPILLSSQITKDICILLSGEFLSCSYFIWLPENCYLYAEKIRLATLNFNFAGIEMDYLVDLILKTLNHRIGYVRQSMDHFRPVWQAKCLTWPVDWSVFRQMTSTCLSLKCRS